MRNPFRRRLSLRPRRRTVSSRPNPRSVVLAYILLACTGPLGGHRFYLGHVTTGAAQLFISLGTTSFAVIAGVDTAWIAAAGMFVILFWNLADAFLIPAMVREFNILN